MRKLSNKKWMAVPAILVLCAAAFSQQVQELTLDDCVNLAVTYNPDIIKSRYSMDQAVLGVRQARSGLFPSLSASASSSATGPVVSAYDDNLSWALSGSVDQQIYRPGLYTGVKQARAEADVSRSGNLETVLTIRSVVEKCYYEILSSRALVGVYEESIHLAEEQIKKSRIMVDLGLKRESDLLKSEVQKGSFETQLVNEMQNLASLKREMNLLMGRSSETPLTLAPLSPEPEPLPDVAEAWGLLEKSNPALKSMRDQVRARDLSLTSAREAFLPTLSGYYAYSRGEDGYTGSAVESDQVGLRMSIDLFGGFDKRTAVQQEKVQISSLRTELDALRRELEQDLRNQYAALRTQETLIGILEKTLESAEKDLEVVSEQYASGLASILDLMDARVSALESRTDLVKTQYRLKIVEAEIRRLIVI